MSTQVLVYCLWCINNMIYQYLSSAKSVYRLFYSSVARNVWITTINHEECLVDTVTKVWMNGLSGNWSNLEADEYRELEIPCKEESLAVAPPRAAPSHMRVVVPKWCQVLVWTPVASVSCVVECGHRFSALTWREGATLTDSLLSHFQLSTPDTSKYFHAPPNNFAFTKRFSLLRLNLAVISTPLCMHWLEESLL